MSNNTNGYGYIFVASHRRFKKITYRLTHCHGSFTQCCDNKLQKCIKSVKWQCTKIPYKFDLQFWYISTLSHNVATTMCEFRYVVITGGDRRVSHNVATTQCETKDPFGPIRTHSDPFSRNFLIYFCARAIHSKVEHSEAKCRFHTMLRWPSCSTVLFLLPLLKHTLYTAKPNQAKPCE